MKLRSSKSDRARLIDLDTFLAQELIFPSQVRKIEHLLGREDTHQRAALAKVDIERTISQLAPGYCKEVVWHDLAGLQHKEIARIAGRHIGNSKSQLFKARKAMREILERKPGEKARVTRRRKVV